MGTLLTELATEASMSCAFRVGLPQLLQTCVALKALIDLYNMIDTFIGSISVM